MINTQPPVADLTTLREKRDALEALPRELAALDALESEHRAAEPDLLKAAAAGSVQHAAELTMLRIKLEVIPAERKKLKGHEPELAMEVWHATSAGIDQSLAATQQTYASIGAEINEGLRPVLAAMLLPNLIPDLARLASNTSLGQRVERLEFTVKGIEAGDRREFGLPRVHPTDPQENKRRTDEFKQRAVTKADRLLAAWAEFQSVK